MAHLMCCTNFLQHNSSAWPDVQVRPLSYTAKFPFFKQGLPGTFKQTDKATDCLETKAAVRGMRIGDSLGSPFLSATKGGKRMFLFAHILWPDVAQHFSWL